MPNIKSAIKRVHVTSVKNLRNRMVKSKMRTAVRKFEAAVKANDLTQAAQLYPSASSALDRAASKGVIHKNAADRKKSRMALSLKKAAN